MTVIGSATLELRGDSSHLTRELGRATSEFRSFGRKMQAIGRSLTTTVTLPLAAIGAASVKMAADAEEAANKFNVVMGDSAGRVQAALNGLNDTIPLTTAEMHGLASGVQDMLVPLGLARDRAADLSVEAVKLAGDLGSFNNVSPKKVLEDIQSALAGSSEPMRKYGVDTREAALESVALVNGLIGVGDELTGAARAQAVFLQIQNQSTDAIGDAARTADSASNSIKFLMRNVKQLGINIGRVLLPVVTPLIQRANELTARLAELNPQVLRWNVALAGVAAAIPAVLLATGTLANLLPVMGAGFAALTGPIGLAAAAIAAVGVAVFQAVKHFDALRLAWAETWFHMVRVIAENSDKILNAMQPLARMVPGLSDRFFDMRDDVGQAMADAVRSARQSLTDMRREVATAAAGVAVTVAPEVDSSGLFSLDKILDRLEAAFDRVDKAAQRARSSMSGATDSVERLRFVAADFSAIGGRALRGGTIAAMPNLRPAQRIGAPNLNMGRLTDIASLTPGQRQDFIDGVPLDQLTGKIKTFGEQTKELLFGVGQDMITGLIQGTLSFGDILKRFLIGFASRFILGPLSGALGIGSPSRVTMKFGHDIGRGFVEGMKGAQPLVRGAALSLAAAATVPPSIATTAMATATVAPPAALEMRASDHRPIHVHVDALFDANGLARSPGGQAFVREAINTARKSGFRP